LLDVSMEREMRLVVCDPWFYCMRASEMREMIDQHWRVSAAYHLASHPANFPIDNNCTVAQSGFPRLLPVLLLRLDWGGSTTDSELLC
jgi:hypothetical protein